MTRTERSSSDTEAADDPAPWTVVASVLGSGTLLIGVWTPALAVGERSVVAMLYVVATIAVATGFARRPRIDFWPPSIRTGLYVFGIAGGTSTLTTVPAILMTLAQVPSPARWFVVSLAVVVAAQLEFPAVVTTGMLGVSLAAVVGAHLSITATIVGHNAFLSHGLLATMYACLPVALTVVGWERLGLGAPVARRTTVCLVITMVVTAVAFWGGAGIPGCRYEVNRASTILAAIAVASYAGRNITTMTNLLRLKKAVRLTRFCVAIGYSAFAATIAATMPGLTLLPLILPATATACLYIPVMIGSNRYAYHRENGPSR